MDIFQQKPQSHLVLSNQKFSAGCPLTYLNCLALGLIEDSNWLIDLAFVTFLNVSCLEHSYLVMVVGSHLFMCVESFLINHQSNRLLDLDLIRFNNYCLLAFITHFCRLIQMFRRNCWTSWISP